MGGVDCQEEETSDFPPAVEQTYCQLYLPFIAEYRTKFANPYIAAQMGYIDDVIDPADTRPVLIKSLEMLSSKRESNPWRKHGNIPL